MTWRARLGRLARGDVYSMNSICISIKNPIGVNLGGMGDVADVATILRLTTHGRMGRNLRPTD